MGSGRDCFGGTLRDWCKGRSGGKFGDFGRGDRSCRSPACCLARGAPLPPWVPFAPVPPDGCCLLLAAGCWLLAAGCCLLGPLIPTLMRERKEGGSGLWLGFRR